MDTGESAQEPVNTIAQGMPVQRLNLWWIRSCTSSIGTWGHGCGWNTRHSLRPLIFRGWWHSKLGQNMPRDRWRVAAFVSRPIRRDAARGRSSGRGRASGTIL